MFSKNKYLSGLFLLIAVIAFGYHFFSPDGDPAKMGVERSGDIALTTLNGDEVSLADYRGKVVLVNFWATWCQPCVKEIPDLVKLRNTYKDQGFEVLGLVVNSPSNQVRKMVSDLGMNYPILPADARLASKFGNVTTIPRTFVLDTEGNIVEDVLGMRSYRAFELMITKHLPKNAKS